MERLTARDPVGNAYFPECFKEPCGGGGCTKDHCEFLDSVCDKLAGYEEQGEQTEKLLTESEAARAELGKRLAAAQKMNAEMTDAQAVMVKEFTAKQEELHEAKSELEKYRKAEQDGRMVVLPVRTKETVYVVGEKRIMECFIAEAYIDDARGLEYMVSFDCDDNCDGCPFNSWRLDWSGEYSCDGEYGESCILGSDFEKTFFLTREEAEAVLAQKGGTHEADTV